MHKNKKPTPWSSLFKPSLCWSAILLLCVNLFLFGCRVGGNDGEVPAVPLYVGIGYDMSRSVDEGHLPQLSSMHVDQLIRIVNKPGGVASFGVIDEKAFESLAKLEVLRVTGRLDERAQTNQKNEASAIAFKAKVTSKISGPRNARATDITGSIARFTLFFNEPNIPTNAQKVALFISDGIDTGPWRKLKGVRLPDGVKVFVVGMESTLAEKLFGKNAVLFESIDSALDSLKDLT